MNKGELRYAEHLEARRKQGEVYAWAFEPIRLRLGDNAWYTPDFLVVLESGAMEIHEYKGHWREAARVRIKVAATNFPWFRFLAIQEPKRGQYAIEEIKAHNEGVLA